jgi:RimJ/RimL family protein N-acetyltransferase
VIAIEPLAPEYFALVAEWLSQPEVNEWLSGEWRNQTVDPRMIGIAVRNKRNRLYLVRSDGQPCGLVALADWDAVDGIAMLWGMIGDASFGGRGVFTEALGQLIRLSFRELHIEALNAWIMADNARSRRVVEKLGFHEQGRLRSSASRNGHRIDRVFFDLLKEDIA